MARLTHRRLSSEILIKQKFMPKSVCKWIHQFLYLNFTKKVINVDSQYYEKKSWTSTGMVMDFPRHKNNWPLYS